jgi:hypothetical protein
MTVSSLAGRQPPGWLGVTRCACCVRCARTTWLSAWPAGHWRDRVAADRARRGGEEGREPGVTVRIGSTAPVWAGNLWQGREKWPLKPDFAGVTVRRLSCLAGAVSDRGSRRFGDVPSRSRG